MNLNIITRCSRPENLLEVKDSVFNNIPNNLIIKWHIIFDTIVLKDIDAELLATLNVNNIDLYFKKCGDHSLDVVNSVIDTLNDWVYLLDDDNIMHPDFYNSITEHIESTNSLGFLFNQEGYGVVYVVDKDKVKVREVDLAQYMIHSSFFKQGFKFGTGYLADGIFIENLYNKVPDKFTIIDKVLCYYNKLEKPRIPNYPKVLVVGKNVKDLTTIRSLDYEANQLTVKSIDDDSNIFEEIASFKPDSIVTVGESEELYPNLYTAPLEIRAKWIHQKKIDQYTGESAYWCGMNYSFIPKNELISFITPIFNTGKKLLKTYESVKNQTYKNWEWVLVNDSNDGGKTLKIAEAICKKDSRVKLYDFREKTGGIIGESKYRGFSLSSGYLLAELDHDDELTENCAMDLYKASEKHKDCGFFYTDCVEVDKDFNSLVYNEGFAFGYGKYRKEMYNGVELDVSIECNINPKTIRHIVGIPNHVRAWRRDTYFKVGGHNRALPIADDYELVVRTFLETKFVRIPKLGYIQYIYNDGKEQNSHDLSRADIQRRVRTILEYYNEDIKKRFEELGIEDWAYHENPVECLDIPSRFGENEMAVNIIYQE